MILVILISAIIVIIIIIIFIIILEDHCMKFMHSGREGGTLSLAHALLQSRPLVGCGEWD